MKILRTLMLAGAAAMLLMGGAAKAATIVQSDSGNLGSFTLTNLGGGNFTLILTPPHNLTLINGVGVSIPATFDAALAFSATVSGSNASVTSGTFTKTFGTGSDIASMSYTLTAGQIGTGQLKDLLGLSGLIQAVAPNSLPGYDFSQLVGGDHTFSLTGANYTGGASSMLDVFNITGASVSGGGGYSESAVPEPASMALLGIGLSGLFTVRRFLQRTRLAA